MKYYSIEGRLYLLSAKNVLILEQKYSKRAESNEEEADMHENRLLWIERHGKLIGYCENLAY